MRGVDALAERRRPASSQPTPSSRRRDPSPVWLRVPCRHLRGDGADAERARVVAAVAAAERAQERAENRAESAMIASRARERRRPASSQPTPSSRRRDPSPVWLRVPCRHLRGDGADAERARVVAAVAAAERAQERAEKRAESAMIASRARVRRRPASSQPTPSSRRRDPSPVWLRVPCRHLRGDGADAERARVVAAVAAAERAQERAENRAESAMIASRARERRRPASSQPTPSSRRRDPSPVWLRVPCRHLRGDGADAERARVVAAVAAAERARRAR